MRNGSRFMYAAVAVEHNDLVLVFCNLLYGFLRLRLSYRLLNFVFLSFHPSTRVRTVAILPLVIFAAPPSADH